VKPENVGIDFDGVAKVFDFGLARELKEEERLSKDEYKLTPQTGSRVYMAPEVFNSQPYGLPYDVYSFSIMVSSLHGILIACQLSPFSETFLVQHQNVFSPKYGFISNHFLFHLIIRDQSREKINPILNSEWFSSTKNLEAKKDSSPGQTFLSFLSFS
jgi:serine/threonine protein kinase